MSNDPTPLIRAVGLESETRVQIYRSRTCSSTAQVGQGVVPSGQNFVEFEADALTNDGRYTYYATLTSPEGLTSRCSASGVITYVLDTANPEITNLQDDSIPQNTKTWTWGCSKAPCIYRYVINQNETHTFPEASPQAYSSVNTATQAGGDGTYWLHVEALDRAGNPSTASVFAVLDNTSPQFSDTQTFTITNPNNTLRPTIHVSKPLDGNISGFYKDEQCSSPIEFEKVGEEDAFIAFQKKQALDVDGRYEYYIRLRDQAENPSDCLHAFSYVLDTQGPTLIGLSNDQQVQREKTWSWSCGDDQGCRYRYIVNPDANYSFPEATEEAYTPLNTAIQTVIQAEGTGTYWLHVEALDQAGNPTSVSVSAILDNTPPDPLALSALQVDEYDRIPNVTVSGLEPDDTLEFYRDAACQEPVDSEKVEDLESAAVFQLEELPFLNETYYYYHRVTDGVKNPSPCSTEPLVYDFHVPPPVIPLSLTVSSRNEMDPNPIVTVGGVSQGYTVNVYTDALCSQKVGSQFIDAYNISSIDILVELPLPEQGLAAEAFEFSFYANMSDQRGYSDCSTATAQYVLQKAPTPQQLLLTHPPLRIDPEPPLYEEVHPIIRVFGVGIGQTVQLYNFPSCRGTPLGSATVSSDGYVDVVVTEPFYLGTHRFYAKASYATNVSDCSPASDFEYILYAPTRIGLEHDCELSDMGLGKCWGEDRWGQLGLPGNPGRMRRYSFNSMARNRLGFIDLGCQNGLDDCLIDQKYWAKDLVPGGRHTCGHLNTDDAKCWGDNFYGQLGISSEHTRSVISPPKEVIDFGCREEVEDCLPDQKYKVKAIALGDLHSVFILNNNQVRGVGSNSHGQIGLSQDILFMDDPSYPAWFDLGEGRFAVAVTAIGNSTYIVLDNGEQKCFGECPSP